MTDDLTPTEAAHGGRPGSGATDERAAEATSAAPPPSAEGADRAAAATSAAPLPSTEGAERANRPPPASSPDRGPHRGAERPVTPLAVPSRSARPRTPRSVVDRVLRRLLAPTVRSLVDEALARRSTSGPDGHDPELFHTIVYPDRRRVHLDPTAVLNNALLNTSSGDITIGRHAFFGHNVSLLTGTHDFSVFGAARQVAVPDSGRDIVIGEGVWLSSNVTVIGPCIIGEHAVVGVNSLVFDDVAPYTVVAGSPAVVRRTIPRPDGDGAQA